MRNVLDEIRLAAARVTSEARWARIDHERLADYADRLPREAFGAAGHQPDPGRHRVGDDEATASFVITLDAINFGSGYFPYIRKRAGMSGYFTIATALREHVDREGPFTAETLRAMTVERCAAIFDQPRDAPLAMELMQRFADALVHLGEALSERYDGSFSALVQSAQGSAAALVCELDRIPEFHDVATYHGYEVPLYKRAQITAYDLSEAFGGEGLGHFRDLDRLTMFADNLVPHVLRVDGVLVFDPSLVACIEAGDDIPSGSEPEVEIRAVALHAVELLVERLRAAGHDVTAGWLDSVLWNRGAGEQYKAVPRHRTRCVYY
ncbi:MAG TPA: queuosine salvage family protein [Acidimicrobiales bacterium]